MTTYSATAEVKAKLDINSSDSDHDTEIDGLREAAYDWINSKLRNYTSVPLTDTAEDYKIIAEAERLIAAGSFRHGKEESKEEKPTHWGKSLKREGEAKVLEYIKDHFQTEDEPASHLAHNKSNDSWNEDL